MGIKKFILLFSVLFVVQFSACKKEKTDNPDGGNTADTIGTVYAAGYKTSNNSKKVALYWRGSNPVYLTDSTNNAEATGITLTGTDLYACGSESNGTKQVAKYWKNGIATNLSSATNNAAATSIVVKGTDVYVAGYETNAANISIAKYWKNGVAVNLTDGSKAAVANAIAVTGTDVYVAGYEKNSTSKQVAKYWKNGTAVVLSDGTVNTSANSIAVNGADVHIAGASFDASTQIYITKYWKNTVVTNLSTGTIGISTPDIYANAVVLSNGDVYVGGNYVDAANPGKTTYWKNGAPLTTSAFSTSYFNQVTSIFVFAGKVYLGGFGNYYGTYPDLAMIWTPGTWKGLDYTSPASRVNSIYVVN